MDRVKIEEVRMRAGIERELGSRERAESIEMVWVCGNNGGVPNGQKGIDDGLSIKGLSIFNQNTILINII